ncbi:MAG: ATP-binding protein [Oceanisphaera sp.]|uniref:ATP-binding protein n=1 Tax=Oceanisphaera sp. TaxID=1929979 RepID=UPI003F9680A8
MQYTRAGEPWHSAWQAFNSLWFVLAVRWLFFVALAGAMLFSHWLLLPVLGPELNGLLLALCLFNGLMTGLVIWSPLQAGLKEVGLLVDILLLTAIAYFSGGVMNPAAALYLFPLLIAALTCSTAFAWGCVGIAMISYGGLFYWYQPLALAMDHSDHGASMAPLFNVHLLGMWLTFSLSAILITASVSWLMGLLARKEQLLQLTYQKQQEQEQFLLLGIESASVAHQLSTPLNNLFLLNEELSSESQLTDAGQQHLALQYQQLVLCRDVLWQLKRRETSGAKAQWLFTELQAYLERWANLRPDVQYHWLKPSSEQDHYVWLDELFWSALLNIMDNAADAGENRVELHTQVDKELTLNIDIYNRQGHLSDEQLAQAGLNQQTSEKMAGLGMGVWLAHATFSRLKGSLTLRNQPNGGVHAHIQIPLTLSEHEQLDNGVHP